MQRILVIDDDQKNIFAMEAILRSRGFLVSTAFSGKEGLLKLRGEDHVSIVLVDMMMPDLDGSGTIRLIRSLGKTRNIPIVAVTALAMADDREKCLAAGANEYLPKPIDVDKLFQIIERFVNQDVSQ